jgi:hypothetical protein
MENCVGIIWKLRATQTEHAFPYCFSVDCKVTKVASWPILIQITAYIGGQKSVKTPNHYSDRRM